MKHTKTVPPNTPSISEEKTSDNDQLNIQVGLQIRKLRKQRGLTQEMLIENADLSASQLSLIENGKVSANVATLWNIARALKVDIARLFPKHNPIDDFEIIRAEDRPEVTPNHAAPDFPGYNHKHIASLRNQGIIEIFSVDVTVTKPEKEHFNTHIGRELVLILEGKVEFLSKGNYKEELGKGDTIHFPSEYPHAYRAIEQPSTMLAILYTPSEPDQDSTS
jgi:XRE family transcriptional regulator, regulator of sulfur utilization